MQNATAESVLPSGALQPGTCSDELAHFATRMSSQFYLSDYNRAKHENAQRTQLQSFASYVPPAPIKLNSLSTAQHPASVGADSSAPLKPLQISLPAPSEALSASHRTQENDAQAALRPQSPRKEVQQARRSEDDGSQDAIMSGRSSPIRAPAKPLRSPSPTRPQHSSVSPMVTAVKHALDLEPEPDHDKVEAVKRPSFVRAASAPIMQPPQTHVPQAVPSHLIKTSKTHPLHISPLLPYDVLAGYHLSIFSTTSALPSPVKSAALEGDQKQQQSLWFIKHDNTHAPLQHFGSQSPQRIGNFLLSSCPGKKVRLTLPFPPTQGNRSAISRDVFLDLERIATNPDYNARAIICCLDDAELAMLGAPWPEYEAEAAKLGLAVYRLPLQEGFAPASIEILDTLLREVIVKYTLKGHNVLCHCRGGVGRAGLVGVAWWLKMGMAGNLQAMTAATAVERCIRWIRQRRSTKAIETPVQVLYLHQFITRLSQNGQPTNAASLLSDNTSNT